MSLSARLSAFFLVALGTVLLLFSASLYVVARAYLVRQLDERLDAALDTLEASVDIEPGGLEWEPDDRRLTLGVDRGVEQVRWAVLDHRGRLVDRSPNAHGHRFPPRGAHPTGPAATRDATTFADAPGWRLATRRLRLEDLLMTGRAHAEDDEPDDDVEYPELTLIVGLSPGPARSTLSRLALTLGVASAATWLACAGMGRALARRALRPLTRMARAARDLDPSDDGWQLPAPGTGDELDDLAHAYNDLLGRLRDAFERQRRFAGDASHQLRTPLTGLLAQLDVALRRERSAGEYRSTLRTAREEADRLRRIVEALLFLARPNSDAARPRPTRLALQPWLLDQTERWRTHPRHADLRIEAVEPPGLEVDAHPELLAQALDNLLDNAFKYSEPGTEVRVAARCEGGHVTLSVADRGVGMHAEDAARVFEPFYRSEMARRRGQLGVGLGLAIASRIAEGLGGGLDVHSEPGAGSRFEIRLAAISPEPGRARDRA